MNKPKDIPRVGPVPTGSPASRRAQELKRKIETCKSRELLANRIGDRTRALKWFSYRLEHELSLAKIEQENGAYQPRRGEPLQ